MELWEFNTFVTSYAETQKSNTANAILSGYYTAYYLHGGKKAKDPNKLIKQLYVKENKQSVNDGFAEIERIMRLEKNGQL